MAGDPQPAEAPHRGRVATRYRRCAVCPPASISSAAAPARAGPASTARPGRTTPPAMTSSGTRRIGPSGSAAATSAPNPGGIGKQRHWSRSTPLARHMPGSDTGARDRIGRGRQFLARVGRLQHKAEHRPARRTAPAPMSRRRPPRTGLAPPAACPARSPPVSQQPRQRRSRRDAYAAMATCRTAPSASRSISTMTTPGPL